MSAVDVLGREVAVGDRIAAAFGLGNTVEIRVGTVLSFTTRASSYGDPVNVMEVDWVAGSGYRPWNKDSASYHVTKPTKIEINLRRFVRLD